MASYLDDEGDAMKRTSSGAVPPLAVQGGSDGGDFGDRRNRYDGMKSAAFVIVGLDLLQALFDEINACD